MKQGCTDGTLNLLNSFHSFLLSNQLNKILKSRLKLKCALQTAKFGAIVVAVG